MLHLRVALEIDQKLAFEKVEVRQKYWTSLLFLLLLYRLDDSMETDYSSIGHVCPGWTDDYHCSGEKEYSGRYSHDH